MDTGDEVVWPSVDIGARVDVSEPAILIRINQLYRSGMSNEALYEATRGVWKAGAPRREKAKYALAVAPGGVVCGVYEIAEWHPAGATPYRTRKLSTVRREGRYEFTGTEAPPPIRDRYIGHSVAHYFNKGNQNPIFYVNC